MTSGCWWLLLGPRCISALGNEAWNICFRFQLLCLGMQEPCSGSLNLQNLEAVPVVTPQTIFHMKPKHWNSLAWGTSEHSGVVPEPTPTRLLVFRLVTKRWFVQKKSEVKQMSSGKLEMEIVLMWGITHTRTGGCFRSFSRYQRPFPQLWGAELSPAWSFVGKTRYSTRCGVLVEDKILTDLHFPRLREDSAFPKHG